MVAAAIRTIVAQPGAEHVSEQFDQIAAMLGRQLPRVERMMRDAREDCSRSPHSRTDVVGVFPNPPRCSVSPAPSSSRPTTSGRSPTAATSEGSMALLTTNAGDESEEVATPALMTA
jgi:putative transposase